MNRFILTGVSLLTLALLPMACLRPVTPVNPISSFGPTKTPSPTPTITSAALATATFTITATPTPTVGGSTFTPTSTPTVTASPGCTYYGQPEINYSPYFMAVNAGNYYANQMSIGQATLMSSLSVGCEDSSVAGETIYVALYDTTSGAQEFSSSFVLTNAESLASDFVTVPVSPAISLPAGTYTMAVIVPTASTKFSLGINNAQGLVDYGTYTGGAAPSNYSSLAGGSQEPGGVFGNSTLNALSVYGCP